MSRDLDELLNQGLGYEEMMNVCRVETRERISEILRLCLPYSDTPEGRMLMEEQLYGVLIQMLTFIQVNTKKFRKERQAKGIEAAKAKGAHFGRKQKYTPDDCLDLFKKVKNGEIDQKAAMTEIGVSPSTFYRMKRALQAEGKI